MADRVVGISIPLTPEQKSLIKSVSGAECQEAMFVGKTSSEKPLRNELTAPADAEMAKMLWATNQDFTKDFKKDADLAKLREKNGGQKWAEPTLVFLR